MAAITPLDVADRERISTAVSQAESASAGEIVTILAERSDDYADVALVWSALCALLALAALAIAPDFYLGLYRTLAGGWNHEWSPGTLFGLALMVAALKFGGVWLMLLWRRLRMMLVPPSIRDARVHARAVDCFKVGAERRTHGRTGILVYLSLAEHRAEIVADEAIASRVDPEVWADAMAAMLDEIGRGRIADGLIAGVVRVGAVLAEHFPSEENDVNELPDRLIEV